MHKYKKNNQDYFTMSLIITNLSQDSVIWKQKGDNNPTIICRKNESQPLNNYFVSITLKCESSQMITPFPFCK